MEEILSLIFHGCKQTRDLESKLPCLINDPSLLASSCEEIITGFSRAADRLKALVVPTAPREQEGSVEECLTPSHTQAIAMAMLALDPFQSQLFSDKNPFDVKVLTTRDAEGSSSSARSRCGGELQVADASDSGKSPVTQQRSRKRKDVVEKHTITAAAPRIGNTEIPPDDGFTWRKYGQKEILGSRFPRSYYRCTHKSFYGCNARKQVQRVDDDPNTYEVTYCSHHTCLMSSFGAPPPSAAATTTTRPDPPEVEPTQPPVLLSTLQQRRWDSMEFETNSPTALGLQMPGGGSFNVGAVGIGTTTEAPHPGPSQLQERESREAEWPVADLADAMFNSGSSSSDMDAFFGHM